MEHFYQSIHGYFNYENPYHRYVEQAPDNAIFVEIGCFLGKSTSFLAVEAINSGKNITIYCIDTFAGTENAEGEDANLNKLIQEHGGNVYHTFAKNTESVSHILRPIVADSTKSAKLFRDNSVDLVFVDAGHLEYEVYNDINAWYPKVKQGGIIAGHDYGNQKNNDPVKSAVDRFFMWRFKKVQVDEKCSVWEVQK